MVLVFKCPRCGGKAVMIPRAKYLRHVTTSGKFVAIPLTDVRKAHTCKDGVVCKIPIPLDSTTEAKLPSYNKGYEVNQK